MQLTFGECCHLMRQNKILFYPLFKKGKYGFGSDSELEGALDHISRIRNIQETHDVGASKKIHDENLFRLYLDKINKCVDSIIPSESK